MLAVVRFFRKEGYYKQSGATCPIAIYMGNEDGIVDDTLDISVSTSKTGPWTLINEYIPLIECKGTIFRPATGAFTAPTIKGAQWGCNGQNMTLLDSPSAILDSRCGVQYVRIQTKVNGGVYCRGRIVIYQIINVGGANTLGSVFLDSVYSAPAGKVDAIFPFNMTFKEATEDGPYTCYNTGVTKYDHLPPDNVTMPVLPEEYEYGWDLNTKVFPKLAVLDTDLAAWTPRFYSSATAVRVLRRRYHPFEENTPAKTGYDPVAFKDSVSVWTNKDLPTFISEGPLQWWKTERTLEGNGQTPAAFVKNRQTQANFLKFCTPLDLYYPTETRICKVAQVVGISYQVLLLEGILKNNFQNVFEDTKTFTEEYFTRQIHHLILRGYFVARYLDSGDYFSHRFFTTRWYRVCKITPEDTAAEEIPYEVCKPHMKLAFMNNPIPTEADGVFLPTPLFPTFSADATPGPCLAFEYVAKDIPMGIGHIWMVN